MTLRRPKSAHVDLFILDNVASHDRDIASFTSTQFGISRQAVSRHLARLVERGLLLANGKTRSRRYELATLMQDKWTFEASSRLAEDDVWRKTLLPHLQTESVVSPDVLDICHYGFTEMLNNAIAHSESPRVLIDMALTAATIKMNVADVGVGIFNKIQKQCGLDDPRHSILELAKGKLTTDPARHTGEGVFFTCRMFDLYTVWSDRLFFGHAADSRDWLLEVRDSMPGTLVTMEIHPRRKRTVKEIFQAFARELDDYGFSKTVVPVELAQYEGEALISRSQAKRLVARFERFKEVCLDFSRIATIGPAFADEVFRVFATQHPGVHLLWMDATAEVEAVILRARSTATVLSSGVEPSHEHSCLNCGKQFVCGCDDPEEKTPVVEALKARKGALCAYCEPFREQVLDRLLLG